MFSIIGFLVFMYVLASILGLYGVIEFEYSKTFGDYTVVFHSTEETPFYVAFCKDEELDS